MLGQLAAAPFEANLILGLVLLAATVGLVFGFYTNRGSGIDNHPINGRYGAPGSTLPDEFHQFADRQIHDHDLREAEIERRVDARMARPPTPRHHPHLPHLHLGSPVYGQRPQADDMDIDEVNRRLAAEAEARKAAPRQERVP